MNIKNILASKMLNKAELSRQIYLSSPAILNQKIKNTAGNKLTEKNISDIKEVFENALKEAEIIDLPKLIDIIRLFTHPNIEIDAEALKTIIKNYQDEYSDIGLMEWFEKNN